jgi:hypothetical protein
LLIDLLKETSCLPSYAKRYLNIIIETQHDLVLFIEHYLNRYKNIMTSIAEFRSDKMESRTLSFEDFKNEFENNQAEAIEKLFLYPHNRIVERTLVIPLVKRKFTLEQLYNFQKENPLLNSILAGKSLCQLP